MSLSKKEVKHIAQLARLELSAEEEEKYREQLSAILEHIAQLQELDTSGIPPTASVLAQGSRLREDTPIRGLQIEEVLQNAPEKQDKQFRVPPVLE